VERTKNVRTARLRITARAFNRFVPDRWGQMKFNRTNLILIALRAAQVRTQVRRYSSGSGRARNPERGGRDPPIS
jgi:hypothetical protein